jgi:hypothetical protein
VEIIIPVRTNWFIVCFLGVWLCGWIVGEVMVPISMFSSGHQAPIPFMIFWLAGWTVGGCFAGLTFLWQLLGREVVRVENSSIITKKAIGSWGRTKEFDLGHVKNLRVAPIGINMFDPSAASQFWGMGGGIIAFDYGAKTFRFGRGIDEPEAKRLIEIIDRHH